MQLTARFDLILSLFWNGARRIAGPVHLVIYKSSRAGTQNRQSTATLLSRSGCGIIRRYFNQRFAQFWDFTDANAWELVPWRHRVRLGPTARKVGYMGRESMISCDQEGQGRYG